MWFHSVVLLFLFSPQPSIPFPSPSDQIEEIIRSRIEEAGLPAKLSVEGDPVHSLTVLPAFYERRGYHPAWTDGRKLSSAAHDLLTAISQASQEGLNPDDYHFSTINSMHQSLAMSTVDEQTQRLKLLADLDLLYTDAFLVYGSHLHIGRLDPVEFEPQGNIPPRQADMSALLELALRSGHIIPSLNSLKPQQPAYSGLRKALANHRAIADRGGWPRIKDGPKLEWGMIDSRVAQLRQRLLTVDYINQSMDTTKQAEKFDSALVQTVKTYQRRNGLDDDGIVGPATLRALNTPVQARIRQIMVNMERYRWLPESYGTFYLMVNIADFNLNLIDHGKPVMTLRAIVGRPYRKTPVFSDRITYLVFNPYWNIPPTIAQKDIIPEIQKNPAYLTQKSIKVFRGWGAGMTEIDPAAVNWQKPGLESQGVHFRQEPGPQNALGRVKFMFPNPYNVYLHDTPSRELFNRPIRGFSSGCIRIERALDLAGYLLKRDAGTTPVQIQAILNKKGEQTVRLKEAVPIYIVYLTAWVGQDGILQLRDDIYQRDEAIATALDRPLY